MFGGLLCCCGYVGIHHINAGHRHNSGVPAERNNGYPLYVPYDSNLVVEVEIYKSVVNFFVVIFLVWVLLSAESGSGSHISAALAF